jgi:CRP/FNR family transcriptional regulator, cyclic AMP receptor protein
VASDDRQAPEAQLAISASKGASMELVGRMLDGSIAYGDGRGLEPVPSGASINQSDKMERLEAVPLFQGCTQRQLRAIAKIAGVFDAPADTVLIRAGEPGEEFFLIVEGTARVHVSARKRLRLMPGDFFGEMSLLDGGPRSATVVAETPLRLLVIRRRNFQSLLQDVPGMTHSLLITLSRRVRHAERALDVSRSARERS